MLRGSLDFEYLFGSEARSIAQEAPTSVFENWSDTTNEQVSDEELDSIVTFLRKLDKARSKLKNKRKNNNKNKSVDAPRTADSQPNKNVESVTPVNQTVTAQKNSDKDYIKKLALGIQLQIRDILSYSSDYETIFSSAGKIIIEVEDEDQIDNSINKLDNDMDNILLGFKNYLITVVSSRFKTLNENYDKFIYLYNVSTVLNKYAASWNLLGGSWTTEEINSVANIRMILLQNGLINMADDASKIMGLGAQMATKSRDSYISAVSSLIKAVKERRGSFSSADYEEMLEYLNTLKTAPGHIRRATLIDEALIEVMRDIGKIIAAKSADLSVELYNSNDTRVWMVNKDEAEKYKKYESQLPTFGGRVRSNYPENKSSRFDAIP